MTTSSANFPLSSPIHLKGADEIAKTFGVTRERIVVWAKEGAPIRMIGKRYQANYAELWAWLSSAS